MNPRILAALGLLLVAAASLQWGSLAFPRLPAIYAPLWLEAAGLALAAWAIGSRGAGQGAAAGMGVAAVAQAAFYVAFGASSLGIEDAALSTLTTLGYAMAAWSFARGGGLEDARLGLAAAAGSMVVGAALDLASGSTFLLLGYLLAVPGWLLAAAASSGWLPQREARPGAAS